MAPDQHPLPEIPSQLGKHGLPEVLTKKNLPRALLAAALLALLAGRTPPARANETTPPDSTADPATILDEKDSAAGAPDKAPLDPADLNGDGTVTNKEHRQYNRAQRRKKRAAAAAAAAAAQPDDDQTTDGSGTGGGAGGGTGGRAAAQGISAAAAQSAATQAQAHSASAGTNASAAADALKNSLTSADAGAMKAGGPDGLGGAARPGAAAGSALAGAGAKPSGNPSDPRSPSDFVLAARSGYAPAFAAAGLKLGADGRSIVRADGSPATADDYARLRRGILQMPAALSRRPDFFAAVSPAHFNDLKEGYRDNPDLAGSVYKHVGTTDADRDFVNTASCSKISGGCNENIDKPSYKKGDYVAPEDLDRMWGSLQKELDDADNPDGAAPQPRGALGPANAALAADAPAADGTAPASTAGGKAGAAAGASSLSPAPAAAAARAARRLWRATAAALGLGGDAGGTPARALELGALGAAGLAALGFVLRKRV